MFDFGFGGSGLFRFLFRSFRWFRWFRSGCSGGFVPVVPGFSTCHFVRLSSHNSHDPECTLYKLYDGIYQHFTLMTLKSMSKIDHPVCFQYR